MINHVVYAFRRIRKKLFSLSGRGTRPRKIQITGEYRSGFGRLVEINRDLLQEVGTWKFIPTNPDRNYDLLICLDRWDALQLSLRSGFDAGAGGTPGPTPSHTITVIRLGHVPGKNGAVPASCIFHASMDLVGSLLGPPAVGDIKARDIIRATVKQLLRYDDQLVNWADTIEDFLDLYEERTRSRWPRF